MPKKSSRQLNTGSEDKPNTNQEEISTKRRFRCIHCNAYISTTAVSDPMNYRSGNYNDPRAPGSDSKKICEVCQAKGLSGKPGTRGRYGVVYIQIQSFSEIDFSLPEIQESLRSAYGVLIAAKQKKILRELGVLKRPIPWIYDDKDSILTHSEPPFRLVVTSADLFSWQGRLERQGVVLHGSEPFHEINDALTWAEEQLQVALLEARGSTS